MELAQNYGKGGGVCGVKLRLQTEPWAKNAKQKNEAHRIQRHHHKYGNPNAPGRVCCIGLLIIQVTLHDKLPSHAFWGFAGWKPLEVLVLPVLLQDAIAVC